MNIYSGLKIYVSVLKNPRFLLIFSFDSVDRNNGVWVYFSISCVGRRVCGGSMHRREEGNEMGRYFMFFFNWFPCDPFGGFFFFKA